MARYIRKVPSTKVRPHLCPVELAAGQKYRMEINLRAALPEEVRLVPLPGFPAVPSEVPVGGGTAGVAEEVMGEMVGAMVEVAVEVAVENVAEEDVELNFLRS